MEQSAHFYLSRKIFMPPKKKEPEFPIGPGIYLITNTISMDQYVGQTKDLNGRWNRHRNALKGGYHKNSHLQNSAAKYGIEAFKFEILEECELNKKLLTSLEQKWMDYYKPAFNKTPAAESMLGFKHSAETIEKTRQATLKQVAEGRSACVEQRIKIVRTNIRSGITKRYISISEAMKDGFDRVCIINVCKGRQLIHRGNFWQYDNDNIKSYTELFSTISDGILSRAVAEQHPAIEIELGLPETEEFKNRINKIKNENITDRTYRRLKGIPIALLTKEQKNCRPHHTKSIDRIDKYTGLVLETFESLHEAQRKGYVRHAIKQAIKNTKLYRNFFWQNYADHTSSPQTLPK